MDYDQLESFILLCETGNMTKTSKLLYRTQPAISARIQNLEHDLGYKLITRTPGKRTITVTAKGKAFLPYARDLINFYREIELTNEWQKNSLTISAISSVKVPILTEILIKLHQELGTKISIETHQTTTAYSKVAANELDAAFVSYDFDIAGVHCEQVLSQNYLLAKYCENPLPIQNIDFDTLDKAKEIHWSWNKDYEQWYSSRFNSRQYSIEVDSFDMIHNIIGKTKGWAIMHNLVAIELNKDIPLQFYHIPDPPPVRKIFLITSSHPDKCSLKILKSFQQYVKNYTNKYMLDM